MKEFYYKALDKNGDIIKNKVLKNNKEDVIYYLKAIGLIPVAIKKSNVLNTNLENLALFKKPITDKQLYILCKQLSFIFSSGIPIGEGSLFIASQSADKRIKDIFNSISNEILKGESFSEAIEKQNAFPMFFTSMVKVSEASGSMDSVMDTLYKYFQQRYSKNDKILSSLLYPILVMVLTVIVIILALIFVIPAYVDMFSHNNGVLPLPTRILLNTSLFFTSNYIFVIIALIIAVYFGALFFKSDRGKYIIDFCMLEMFFIKDLYLKNICFRFSTVLSILHKSGVKITDSLEIIKEVINNSVLDKHLNSVILRVSQGQQISNPLSEIKYFDSLFIFMLELGEETGLISETMNNYSKYLDFEIESQIAKINKLIEPVFTIIIGVIVLFILLALMLPSIRMTELL